MSTPEAVRGASWPSERVTACSTPWARVWAVRTRSGPKTSRATAARSSTSRARGESMGTQTTASQAGSSSARTPSTSLSAMTAVTATRWRRPKTSSTASTRAATPWGLCAASTRTVGEARSTSRRPGLVAEARPSWTTVAGRALPPMTASTAASARSALWAW